MALQPAMAAPKFKGTAVIKGQFKDISLDDYDITNEAKEQI
mgnify:CR=1 FL=1